MTADNPAVQSLRELSDVAESLFASLLTGPVGQRLREPIRMGPFAWDRVDHGEGPLWVTLRTTQGECLDTTGFISREPTLAELLGVMEEMSASLYLQMQRLLSSDADYDKDRLRYHMSELFFTDAVLASEQAHYDKIVQILRKS